MSKSTELPNEDSSSNQEPTEQTCIPSDVWRGFDDGSGAGDFTHFGRKLLISNRPFAEVMARQAMYDLTVRFPHLYPQQFTTPPPDKPELRRAAPASKAPVTRSLPDAEVIELFGPNSNAGKVHKLSRTNPSLYEATRARAVELGRVTSTRTRQRRK